MKYSKKKNKQIIEIGYEYFEGDVNEMTKLFKDIVHKISGENIETIIKETNKHMCDHKDKNCHKCKEKKEIISKQ